VMYWSHILFITINMECTLLPKNSFRVMMDGLRTDGKTLDIGSRISI